MKCFFRPSRKSWSFFRSLKSRLERRRGATTTEELPLGITSVIRNDPNANSALVGLHGSDERPGVGVRVVDFHGREILHAVVAANGPQPAHVGDQGNSTSGHVHRGHEAPPETYEDFEHNELR